MNSADKLRLYPHNLEAALKVKEQFDDGSKVASILHATGTGKTYVALYLAMEYKQDKIVWLVSSNAIKEHIERTINSNHNLSMERDFPNLEIRTYQSLINLTERELEEIPCDFLITDEFHHLGAPVWGERVNTFIDTHEDMKTFGMTAYSVRDRGTVYERDMTNPDTEEIFSDTVESVYDLYDALCDGILPKPIAKSVITEDSEIIEEIKDRIEMLKRKGDESYLSYEKVLDNIIKLIHQQNGVKELICQSVKPGGKYIYFCPVYTEEGKNDIEAIMESMRISLQERYPGQKIVLYKSTSKDEDNGKYHRDCFYSDKDLSGNDASNAIKIIFVKNQYNEGVHAPNVDGVFLGRRTKSDIVAFEQIGRALSVRNNTHEKLISPIIIDLADNIEYLEELETNLGNRIRERQTKGEGKQREIKITDATLDIDVINKDLYSILKDIRTNLNMKTWDKYYELAVEYYKYHKDSEIPSSFKTINGYEYDENGVALGAWCERQRQNRFSLSEERRKKLELIEFRFETNKHELTWDRKYQLAVAYYKYHGNLEIPTSFKTINGYDEITEEEYQNMNEAQRKKVINLGNWINNQRRNIDNLTEERRKKLEAIEFRFETNKDELEWERKYQLALAYYQHYGNSEIPSTFRTLNGYEYDENGVKLGIWCSTQRTNQKKLSEERRKKLEAIGFRFEDLNELEWERKYQLALIYYKHHGNSEIIKSFKTINGYEYDENGILLGNWIQTQRQNIDNLTEERRKKLEAIGFRFEDLDELEWERKYQLALIYYKHHGNSEIPSSFKTINGYEEITDEEYERFDEEQRKRVVNLGPWCGTQRSKQKKLFEERRKKLEAIEFRFESNKKELEWEKNYQLALIYYKHHGNSEIPTSFKTINGYEEITNEEYESLDEEQRKRVVNLGFWCTTQRSNKNLKPERRRKLELIEFRFETKKITKLEWDDWYQLAIVYYQHHGNSEIAHDFKTINGYKYDENGVGLGNWISRQRSKEKILSKERKKKLEAIEFRFETIKNIMEWDDWYQLVVTYYQHHGNSEIAHDFKTINGYNGLSKKEYERLDEEQRKGVVKLGRWCDSQRQRQARLSQERRKKLELIGFRFVTKDESILKKKKLCSEYGIEYDKHKILDKMSYQELYAKIMYLVDNNQPLEISGKLHEIFTMSNENMVLKYMISKEELIMNYYINNKGRGI